MCTDYLGNICIKLAGYYLVNKLCCLVCYEVEVRGCWKEDINGALQVYIDLSFCFQFKVLKKVILTIRKSLVKVTISILTCYG